MKQLGNVPFEEAVFDMNCFNKVFLCTAYKQEICILARQKALYLIACVIN